jgi:hypothetical protein
MEGRNECIYGEPRIERLEETNATGDANRIRAV